MTTRYKSTLRAAACLATALCAATALHAKTPRQMLETMPAELRPNNATPILQPDSISPCTVRCKVADGTTMEITALPPSSSAEQGATPLFCLLTTCNTPEPETTCDLYTPDWQRVKSIPLAPYAPSLMAKPDTMDATEYAKAQKLMDFPLVEAHFTTKSPATVELSLHVPMLGREDKPRVDAILIRKEYKITPKGLQNIDVNQ